MCKRNIKTSGECLPGDRGVGGVQFSFAKGIAFRKTTKVLFLLLALATFAFSFCFACDEIVHHHTVPAADLVDFARRNLGKKKTPQTDQFAMADLAVDLLPEKRNLQYGYERYAHQTDDRAEKRRKRLQKKIVERKIVEKKKTNPSNDQLK